MKHLTNPQEDTEVGESEHRGGGQGRHEQQMSVRSFLCKHTKSKQSRRPEGSGGCGKGGAPAVTPRETQPLQQQRGEEEHRTSPPARAT